MMMNKSEQERRKKIWKEYQHQHSLELMAYAMDRGFYDESAPEDMVLAEAFSRCLVEKAIRKNYSDYHLYSMPLYWHFDFLLVDAEGKERGIEAKFRLNDKDEYTTDNISLNKKEWNATASETIPIDLYYVFFDGNVRVYDLNGKSEEGKWTHSRTTAIEGETVTDRSIAFNPLDNLWTTSVTMPF